MAGLRNLFECHAVASGPGFGFAVADDAGGDEIGVVEHRAKGMAQRIAELAAFVDADRASPARRGSGCRRETRTA